MQTPHQQTDKLDLAKHPDMISAGGGFGPVRILISFVLYFHVMRTCFPCTVSRCRVRLKCMFCHFLRLLMMVMVYRTLLLEKM